jgi:hypothetical protein
MVNCREIAISRFSPVTFIAGQSQIVMGQEISKTMKFILGGICVVCFSPWIFSAVRQTKTEASAGKPVLSRTPVVVELFTSEGCSSCPPADALLATLSKDQPVLGADVIAIEEHVDYWDGLGWKDPFSSPAWTRRQREYAAAFRNGSVYTPQMVVDGQAEFVGSRKRQSEQEISAEARRTKTEVIVTSNRSGAEETPRFSVRVGKLMGGTSGDFAEIWLGVAENNLESEVRGGENAGEHLRHSSVLRTLAKIGVAEAGKDESFSGNPLVRLDHAWKPENTRVIVFVQERKSRKILGASEADLSR